MTDVMSSTIFMAACYNFYMDFSQYFPKLLKELRDEKGLTHKELSQKIGCNESAISLWESGKREPTARSLIALATFFDVTADYLLGLENYDGSKVSRPL